MSLLTTYRYRELLTEEPPERDDFDEAYEAEREIGRDGGDGSVVPVPQPAAVSPSPEEPS